MLQGPARRQETPTYIPIPLSSLRMDSVTGFRIFIQMEPGEDPVLFRESHLPVTPAVFERLADSRHKNVYIENGDQPAYRRYIEDNLDSILEDPELPVETKSEVLYNSAAGLMQDAMDEPRSGELVQRSRGLVASAHNYIKQEQKAFRHLMGLVSYDYYTYTHSVNVFFYSFALAKHCGITADQPLQEIGEGTLLHDIGKSEIDPAIVKCTGPLNAEQWKEMKLHPVYGYDMLKARGEMTSLALDVVRGHHEKLDGSGYPDGLSGDEIDIHTRIVTIVDIFDALTTQRPYKKAMSTFDALTLMREKMRGEIDEDIYRSFIQLLGAPDEI